MKRQNPRESDCMKIRFGLGFNRDDDFKLALAFYLRTVGFVKGNVEDSQECKLYVLSWRIVRGGFDLHLHCDCQVLSLGCFFFFFKSKRRT